MARLALVSLIALPLWASCGSSGPQQSRFFEPNALMGEEIRNRISQIPYQHREELFHNLLWLVQAGEQGIPSLLEGMRHSDPKLRSNCAWVLGQIGDRRVIPDLQPLMSDANNTVRLEVARTLVQLGDLKHCAPLIDALDSDKVQVRYLCHEALKGATGQDFGYDHLSDNVQQRRTSVLAWRRWWGTVSGDPWFAKAYARRHGMDDDTPAAPDAIEVVPPAPMFETEPPDSGQGAAQGTEPGALPVPVPVEPPKPDRNDG